MIELKYGQFMNFGFSQTMQKVSNFPLAAKSAQKLKKLTDIMQFQRAAIQKEYQEMVKSYAKVDEKGEVISVEGKPEEFEIDDARAEEWKKAQEAFGEKTFTIDRPKFPLELLGNIQLSAAELTVLEPILAELEEEKAGPGVPTGEIAGRIGPKGVA